MMNAHFVQLRDGALERIGALSHNSATAQERIEALMEIATKAVVAAGRLNMPRGNAADERQRLYDEAEKGDGTPRQDSTEAKAKAQQAAANLLRGNYAQERAETIESRREIRPGGYCDNPGRGY